MVVSPGKTRYLPALTGLRAVAAYLVFLHHYNPAPSGTLAWHLFNQGYIGVAIFFVLSGFLIYHRYADTYFQRQNWSWWCYLNHRFARIYPLYAVLLLITAGVSAWRGHPMSLLVLGLNLTLLKGFFTPYAFSGIAQSWSLTVEVCFYLLAPSMFLILKHWGAFRLTCILMGTGLVLWMMGKHLAWHGLFATLPFLSFYTFFGRGFEFVLGMWLARCWQEDRLPGVAYPMSAGVCILAVCVSWQAGLSLHTGNPTLLAGSEVLVYNLILPTAIGFLFMGLLVNPSPLGQALSLPVMQALGRSSYAFYLIHIGILASGLKKTGVTNHWLLFSLLIGMALLLHRFVEIPLQRLLRTSQ